MKRIKHLSLAVFFALAVFASGVELYAQNGRGDSTTRIAEQESGDRFTISAKTRKGANVYAVKTPSALMLNAIDRGLDDLFTVSAKNGYRARLRHSDYTIYIARADRQKDSSGNYSPDLAVSAGQYAGSDYDKGGYIYAAGMVIAYNPCAFVIAEHSKNPARVSEVVRYEGEHLILYHNDRRRYNETADHSGGGGHPILN